ncbi:transposase [Methylocella tundrae]|uniref:Transposase n=1 Tax=Methylocella tundrae TaxID=227605 RepID=A0A4U8Z4Z2_METTU|nr:transposase [Methylocella tundrae]
MSDLFWLSPAQMRRIEPYFPLSHGVARVDDRRVISGIIFVIRNGLRWRDAPKDYGPHKTIYNRFIRWSRLGVFNRIFAELAAKGGKPDRLMIDATHLKAHRTAASLLKKRGCSQTYRAHQGRPELQASRGLRWPGPPTGDAAERRPDERLQGRGPDAWRLAESQGHARRQRLRRRLVPQRPGPNAVSSPASRRRRTAKYRSTTTARFTVSATGSRTCSAS